MATDVLSVWNLALRHLGNSNTVASLTEASAEARACSAFYQQTQDEVLGDFPWPFATKTSLLALVQERPTPEWRYSYRYPVDCLSMRRILSTIGTTPPPPNILYVYTRNPDLFQVIRFRIAADSAGSLIYADWPYAMAEYTMQITDVTRYSAQFVQAVALKLALYIAPSVTGGDPFKLGQRAAAMYQNILDQAQANALNEQFPDVAPDDDFIQARC